MGPGTGTLVPSLSMNTQLDHHMRSFEDRSKLLARYGHQATPEWTFFHSIHFDKKQWCKRRRSQQCLLMCPSVQVNRIVRCSCDFLLIARLCNAKQSKTSDCVSKWQPGKGSEVSVQMARCVNVSVVLMLWLIGACATHKGRPNQPFYNPIILLQREKCSFVKL